MPSAAEVKTHILGYMPPGAVRWMALDGATGAAASLWTAIAQAVKVYGFDVLDTLRSELHAREMVQRLSDWEAILHIPIDASLDPDKRRAKIIARRREFGSSSDPNILASARALTGPLTGDILEMTRSVLTAANWYELSSYPAIASSADTDIVIAAADNAPASQAGAQVTVRITHPSIEDLTLTIIAPDATQSSALPFGSGAVTDQDFRFYWKGAANKTITGNWTIRIADNGGAGGNVIDPAGDGITGLFVGGIGQTAFGGPQGLESAIFEWALVINEALVNAATYDRAAVIDLARRWNPAHCNGGVALYMTDGVLCALCDDPNAIADLCVAC